MATTPTQLPVPSEKPQDLKFNAGKIDEFATSMGWTYYDRFGVRHYTIEGLKHVAEQAISAFGYITIDSFQAGAQLPNNQLTLPNQVLRDTSNGEYYRWDGVFPKTVTIASTPITTGGIGIGAWLSVGDATLRSNLNSNEVGKGASLVGTESGDTVQQALDKLSDKYSTIKREDGFYLSTFTGAKTFNIPSDYPNMQAAVDDLHIQTTSQGVYIILNLESGYKEKVGLKVQHGDFSRFYIKSATGTVQVADDFIGVVGPDGGSTITSGTVIMAYHARGPVLGCVFDGRQIARTLYFALGGSYGWADRLLSDSEEIPNPVKISGGTNFRHATFQAQEVSSIVCENTLATNCLLHSIYCERNSMIHAEFSDVSGAGFGGVVCTRGGIVNADTVNANGRNVGFWAHRGGSISASDSTADNCKANGYRTDTNGVINAHHTSAKNTDFSSAISGWTGGGYAYFAWRGGRINATGDSDASGSIIGVGAVNGGEIDAYGIIANNTTQSALYARDGSRVSASLGKINGSLGRGVYCFEGRQVSFTAGVITNTTGNSVEADFGSSVTVKGSTITTSSAGSCLYANGGSKIDAYDAKVSSGFAYDLRVEAGGNISLGGASTYSTANIAVNTLLGKGIIFKP